MSLTSQNLFSVSSLQNYYLYHASNTSLVVILHKTNVDSKLAWVMYLWNIETEKVQMGQWLIGKNLLPNLCDISPDGQLFSYTIKDYRIAKHYCVISRPPYFTALCLYSSPFLTECRYRFNNSRFNIIGHEPNKINTKSIPKAYQFHSPRDSYIEPKIKSEHDSFQYYTIHNSYHKMYRKFKHPKYQKIFSHPLIWSKINYYLNITTHFDSIVYDFYQDRFTPKKCPKSHQQWPGKINLKINKIQ